MNQFDNNILQQTFSHNRIPWVDVLKLFGMLGIYISHFMESGGKIYPFTFTFLAEMFFLMSGFFAASDIKEKFLSFVWGKFKRIMIPYFSFSLLFELIAILSNNIGAQQLFRDGKMIFFGIRTTLSAPALWFLPCLFLITVLYRAAIQIFRNNKYIVLVLAFAIFCFFPYKNPSWFWNFDSALKYFVFFALGPVIFPWINKLRFRNLQVKGKIINAVVTVCCLCFTAFVYFSNIDFAFQFFQIQLPSILYKLYRAIAAAVIIVPFIQLALVLERIPVLSDMGRQSLIFCGTETATKALLSSFLSIFGITVQLTSTLATVLYAGVCLTVSYFLFAPLFKKYFKWALGLWKRKDKSPDTKLELIDSAITEKETVLSH